MDTPETSPSDEAEFDLVLSRPRGWTDESLYSFSAPRPHGPTGHTANVVVGVQVLPAMMKLERFVATTYQSYADELPDLQLVSRRTGRIGAFNAHELIFTWDADEYRVRHRMVFRKSGLRGVVTFNASAADEDFADQAEFFNEVLASIERRRR